MIIFTLAYLIDAPFKIRVKLALNKMFKYADGSPTLATLVERSTLDLGYFSMVIARPLSLYFNHYVSPCVRPSVVNY